MSVPLVDNKPGPVEFRVSLCGRIHYAIRAIMFLLFMVPLMGAIFFLSMDEQSWTHLVFSVVAFLGSFSIGAYSLSQLLKKSPRFILDEHGFTYRGFVGGFQSDWTNVTGCRVIALGLNFFAFDFLEVRFVKSPSRFRNSCRMDASGLIPDSQTLLEIFRKHVRKGG